jgi:putative DNA primase/helicase
MELILYAARCTGNEKNCLYPDRHEITGADDLIEAVRYDHVCAEYKGNYRSNENFITSQCIVMDCDNDHTEDPAAWVTPEALAEEFEDVSYAITFSRHHMKVKNGKPARPKFHIYFEIPAITDPNAYAELKVKIQKIYPFFDDNALDAGRFIYGSETEGAIWHEGKLTIDAFIREQEKAAGYTIPAGKRNSTLSKFAGRVVKRYGHTDEAHKIFLEEADKCDPPLSDDELSKIWNSAKKWEKKVSSQPGYVPPDQFNAALPKGPAGSLKPADYSDIGQAKVLSDEYGDELRYSEQTGFLHYDGVFWEVSASAAIGATEEFLDLQLADAELLVFKTKQALINAGVTEEELANTKKAAKDLEGNQLQLLMAYMSALTYHAFVMQRRNMRYINSAMQAAQPMVYIKYEDLDNEPFLLNTPEATYDLREGISSKREHKAEDYMTKVTLVEPGDAGADIWQDTLQKTFLGDKELIDYVQAVMGLAAIGHVYVEALIIAYGDGHNGKSTFFNSVARVLGSYSGSISADTLTVGVRRNTKWEITELKGKRLAIAAELEEGQRLSTSVLKQITSTDKIQGERKFKDPGDFTPSHTVVLYTNHLPRVGASDSGTWRRLIVIPFNASFTGKGDVKNYSDFLVEKAGPAILSWVIEGAKKAIDQGYHLKRPKVVVDAINEYKASNDWMSNFMEDCCEVGDDFTEKSGDLYIQYRAYCDRIGEFIRSTTEFYTELKNRGFSRKRTNKGVIVRGLRLKMDDFMD